MIEVWGEEVSICHGRILGENGEIFLKAISYQMTFCGLPNTLRVETAVTLTNIEIVAG